jgi:hypothetical protein
VTMGLACDRDGYDLRAKQCAQCGSRGCPKCDHCKTVPPQPLAPGWLQRQVDLAAAQVATWRAEVPNRLKGSYLTEDGDAT